MKINDDELEQLDEEFSDIGDFDDTVTSESPKNLHNEPDGAASVTGNYVSSHSTVQTSSERFRGTYVVSTTASPDSGIVSKMYGSLPTHDETDVEIEVRTICDFY